MARKTQGSMDDALRRLVLNDFSGGWNVNTSALALAPNESPEILNLIPFPGRLLYRGGTLNYSDIPFSADADYAFYDSTGNKHICVWAGGNLYDVVNGTANAIESAVYTAGERVGHVDLNGTLYWSTKTVPIRFWTPSTGATGVVPKNGTSNTPSSPLLMIYTNAIVAFGVNFGTGFQSNVFSWSNVNAPDHWDASNSQAVGPNNGAALEFALVMGVAEVGVPPFRSFIVGRSDIGVYGYQGALGSLAEFLVSCPVGCADGASAVFAPSAAQFGTVIFLGTDGQFYQTNGVTCQVISTKVLPWLSAAYIDAKGTPGSRFWGGYNLQYQYYFCNVGGQQYVYKWDVQAWSLFQGWPVGPSVNFTDIDGLPACFIATNLPYQSTLSFLLGQVGIPASDDNGVVPQVYYKTPYLHMGDVKKYKEYHWIAPQFYAKGAIYAVSGQSLPRAIDNSNMITKELVFTTPFQAAPNEFILDESLLDGTDLLGGAGDQGLIGSGRPVGSQARLVCPYTGKGMLAGINSFEILKGCAAQFTVSLYPQSSAIDYELVGLEILWIDRGYMRDSGNQYNPESGVPYGFPGYPPFFDGNVPPELQLFRTTPNAYKLRADSSPGAAFLPLPGMRTYAGYTRFDGPCFGGNLITLSADKLHLFVLCQDTAQNNFFVLKISTVTGAIEASISTPTMGFISNEANLFMSPVNPNVVYVLWSYGTPLNITLWELNASTMALNRSVALDGTNPSSLAAAAISADGTTMAVQENGATNSEIYIVDLAAFTATSFAQPPNTGTNNRGCAFVPGSNSEVLVGDLTALEQITRYTTGGAVVTTYALGLPEPIVDLSTSSGSPLVFGWSTENFPTPPRVFAYNLGTAALTTAVASNGSPDDQACIVPVGARVYTQQNNLAEIIKFDGAASSSASFPSGANQQHWNGLAIDATHGIIYTAGDINDGVNYPLLVQAIALF